MRPTRGLSALTGAAAIAEVQRRVDSAETKIIRSLRDRAILAVMEQVTVSVDAVIELRVLDYYRLADEHWLRITEEGTQRDILDWRDGPKIFGRIPRCRPDKK